MWFTKKLRSGLFGAVGVLAYRLTMVRYGLRGKKIELPNYTLLEPGLFIGGACTNPPPETRVVLNLSANRDAYSVEEYRWEPLHSGVAPTVRWLEEQVAFIDASRKTGKTVFVHCDAGMDRSALVVAAYLMRRDKVTRDAAVNLVQRKRAVVRLNPVFSRLLEEWEAVCRS